MNLVYENSNLSGIGDRLLDLFLVYTYAKHISCENLFLEWRVNHDDMMRNDSIHGILRKTLMGKEKQYS